MKNKLTNLILVTGLVAFLAACSNAPKDKSTQLKELKTEQARIAKEIAALQEQIAKETPDSAKANVKAKEVDILVLEGRNFDHYVKTQGSVESEENILVSAKTMGVITQVNVREGQMVSKGQILAHIDNSLIESGIEEVKSQLNLANTVFERQKNLWDQKIGTEVQFLQAKANKESLEKRLASMEEQNDMSRIKAPVNGVVDALEVKVGQNIAPGMPAARVVNNSDLKITANISEAYVLQLKPGNKVLVSFPDINKTLEAKLSFVGRNIDPMSRTFPVEAELPSSADLRPNMTAVIRVVYNTANSAIVVPINVVQQVNNEKIVYIAEPNGNQTVARKRVVTVEGVFDSYAQVKGLNPGDKLITSGFQGLNDGQFVKI
jgi:RND family efflux transporter MFP subunit